MERVGFVARIEEDLERTISLGRLPKDGSLPSENMLARHYGVSRTTVREALLRLAARGLVAQHPGRKSRVVPMGEAITLESLSVALHAEGPAHPERRRLLEGYLALKREMTVELLAACCEHATESELEKLRDACFQLREEARWKEGRGWVEREFNLLRLAALGADRPGHFLLIQSLERSFWGMAARLLPHLNGEAICKWAECAFSALCDKDAQALRQKLAPLLQVSDEHVLRGLSPAHEAAETPAVPRRTAELLPEPPSQREATRDEPPPMEQFQELYAELDAAGGEPLSAEQSQESYTEPDAARGEPSSAEQFRESNTEHEAIAGALSPAEQLQQSHTAPTVATDEPSPTDPLRRAHTTPDAAQGGLSAEVSANLSACWTGSDQTLPAGAPPPRTPSEGFGTPVRETALGKGRSPGPEEPDEVPSGSADLGALARSGPGPES